MFEMLCGKTPFYTPAVDGRVDEAKIRKKIQEEPIVFPDYVSLEAQDLILRLLDRKTVRRMDVADVKRHPWIINKCLEAEKTGTKIMKQ